MPSKILPPNILATRHRWGLPRKVFITAVIAAIIALHTTNGLTPARAATPASAPTSTSESASEIYGCTTKDNIVSCKDVWFASPKINNGYQRLYMNIYLPADRPGPHPLLIYVHGGGYVVGNRYNCPGEMTAARGYALACIEYRYSYQAVFPAQIYDVKRSIRWLRAHAGTYNVDPNRFGIWGDSSGGHLAALAGASNGYAELEGPYGYLTTSSDVQAVADWYGPTDFTQVPAAFEAPLTWPVQDAIEDTYGYWPWYTYTVITNLLVGGPVSQHLDLAWWANPLTFVDPTDPPFFILHGEQDDVVPVSQSQRLSDWLGANGVPVTFVRESWRGHTPSDQGYDDGSYGHWTIEMTMQFFDNVLVYAGQ